MLKAFSLSFAIASLLGVSLASSQDHWAVLVAGSNGYWNYRHQADIYHAYQIVKSNGIPEDQIITFAFDDIANNPENPFPGQVFNSPTGEDVYQGLKLDYTGKDVTPEKFLAVLKGDAMTAGGKVLKSDAHSKVFINFADHGAPGLIAFPKGQLYADQFHKAIDYMYTNKMYKEMVIYIEACESGSMFHNLLEKDTKVYGVTAANPNESSWGTYCYPHDKVKGKHINSCLGDLFSVNWMENTEMLDVDTEPLSTQFKVVQQATTKSHVMKYGDESFTKEDIYEFEGGRDNGVSLYETFFGQKSVTRIPAAETPNQINVVESRDAKLHHLYAKTLEHKTPKAYLDLQTEIAHRMRVDATFQDFAAAMKIDTSATIETIQFNCLRHMVSTYEEKCFDIEDYDYKHVRYLALSCDQNSDMEAAAKALIEACNH